MEGLFIGKSIRFRCVFGRKACVHGTGGTPETILVFKRVTFAECPEPLENIWVKESRFKNCELAEGDVVELTAVADWQDRAWEEGQAKFADSGSTRFFRLWLYNPTDIIRNGVPVVPNADKAKPKGKCDRCGKEPRVLKRAEAGQAICQTCWRELFPPRSKNLATLGDIEYLRKMGFDVPDDLTKEEANRLGWVNSLKWDGITVAADIPLEDLKRLSELKRLQPRGVAVANWATSSNTQSGGDEGELVRHFRAAVAGVAHDNRDGTSRQEIISRCSVGERLRVKHEKENPVDPNAVAIVRQNGEQVGCLTTDLAAEVSKKMAQGWRYAAVIEAVAGKGMHIAQEGMHHLYGLSLALVFVPPGASDSAAEKYIGQLSSRFAPTRDAATVGYIAPPHEAPANQTEIIPAVTHVCTEVAGVTHNNRDGTSRQEIISRCSVGERLRVKHEKENPVDPNAVALLRQNGEQVGYLKVDLAAEIVQKGGQGWRYAAVIQKIDGDDTESRPRSAVVALVVVHPDTSKDIALEYVARLQRESDASGLAPRKVEG